MIQLLESRSQGDTNTKRTDKDKEHSDIETQTDKGSSETNGVEKRESPIETTICLFSVAISPYDVTLGDFVSPLIQSAKKNDTCKKQVSNRLLQAKRESVVKVENKQTEIDLNQFLTKDLAKSSNAC